MQSQLVIFDLDGTLIDSLPDLTHAVNHMLRQFGREPRDLEGVRKLVGQGARSLVERALAGAPTPEIEAGLESFLQYNLAHIVDHTRPYPGVIETLTELKESRFELCVLSNKNVALCREVLDKLDLSGYFSGVFGADSFPFRKPSPEPVRAVLEAYRRKPSEAVMVGDSINDIAAGRDAGVTTIGCCYGYGDEVELKDADYVVDSFAGLLQVAPLEKNARGAKKVLKF